MADFDFCLIYKRDVLDHTRHILPFATTLRSSGSTCKNGLSMRCMGSDPVLLRKGSLSFLERAAYIPIVMPKTANIGTPMAMPATVPPDNLRLALFSMNCGVAASGAVMTPGLPFPGFPGPVFPLPAFCGLPAGIGAMTAGIGIGEKPASGWVVAWDAGAV